tara:strand:- start:41 stop:1090 length:1050 start_codon:yes stop_codon:yes gene_type:complete
MPYIGRAPSSGIRSRFIYTATAAQTTFTGADGNGKTLGYTDGEYVDVYLNGVLLDPADYTATSKTSVVLDSGATVSDIVEIVVYDTFSVFNGTFTGDLTVDGDTLFVDASADTVGINTSSPTRPLTVSRDSSSSIVASFESANSQGAISLKGSGTSSDTAVRFAAEGNELLFFVNGSERWRITSTGNFKAGTNGLGIDFSAVTGSGADSSVLDDYEKGTWTPAYSISGATFSYGLQSGKYVKVGDMVVASCRIRGQRSGGSGDLQLTGLPYATSSASNLNQAASIGFTNGWTTSPKGALTGVNNTIIVFKKSGSSSALSNITDDITEADVSTSSTSSNDLILTVAYVAA